MEANVLECKYYLKSGGGVEGKAWKVFAGEIRIKM